jgi:hypothetical protein
MSRFRQRKTTAAKSTEGENFYRAVRALLCDPPFLSNARVAALMLATTLHLAFGERYIIRGV